MMDDTGSYAYPGIACEEHSVSFKPIERQTVSGFSAAVTVPSIKQVPSEYLTDFSVAVFCPLLK